MTSQITTVAQVYPGVNALLGSITPPHSDSTEGAQRGGLRGLTPSELLDAVSGHSLSPALELLMIEVQATSDRISGALVRVTKLREMSQAYSNQINDLRKIEAVVRKWAREDGTVDFVKFEPNGLRLRFAQAGIDPDRAEQTLRKFDAAIDPETGKLTITRGTAVGFVDLQGSEAHDGATLSADVLQSEIQRLESEGQKIDGVRERDNLHVQEALQLKQRLVTLASNVLQTLHKTQEAVVSNTRA